MHGLAYSTYVCKRKREKAAPYSPKMWRKWRRPAVCFALCKPQQLHTWTIMLSEYPLNFTTCTQQLACPGLSLLDNNVREQLAAAELWDSVLRYICKGRNFSLIKYILLNVDIRGLGQTRHILKLVLNHEQVLCLDYFSLMTLSPWRNSITGA